MRTMTKKEIKNYNEFMAGLEKLTKQHGIAIQSAGCFIHFDLENKNEVEQLKKFEYTRDYSSGDLDNNLE